MKILHCSDLHLGRKVSGSTYSRYFRERYEDYFRAFTEVVDFAITEKVEMMMITGDIFDKRDLLPDVLERAENIFKKVKDAGIKVIAIEGNHDRLFDFESSSWLDYLKNKDYMILLRPSVRNGKVFFDSYNGKSGGTAEIGGVNFYGIGYQGINFPEYIKALGDVLDQNRSNIVMIHAGVSEQSEFSMPGFLNFADFTPLDGKCIYIASGHLHSKSIHDLGRTRIFIPGALEYWDISESGKRGFFIFDTHSGSVDFFESKKRKKIDKTIKIEDGDYDEFRRIFHDTLEGTVEKDCIYSVNVKIPFDVFRNINISELEDEIEQMGALKGSVKVFSDNGIERNDETFSFYDVEKSIISKDPNFGRYSDNVVSAIDVLKDISDSSDHDEALKIIDDLFDKIMSGD